MKRSQTKPARDKKNVAIPRELHTFLFAQAKSGSMSLEKYVEGILLPKAERLGFQSRETAAASR